MLKIIVCVLSTTLLAATVVVAQDAKKKIEPGCNPVAEAGCARVCLDENQLKRIVEYRTKQGKEPKWRPSICDGTTYGSGNCEYSDWSEAADPCVTVCRKDRAGSYAIYNKSLWKGWGNGYACKLKS